MTTTALFYKHDKLLKKQAWVFSRRFNIEFEEVYSEAALIFVRAAQSYEPTVSKFITYLYTVLHNGLVSFCVKFKDRNPCNISFLEKILEVTDIRIDKLSAGLSVKTLSVDAQLFVEFVMSGKFHTEFGKRWLRPDIQKYMIKNHNWDNLKYRSVMRECRNWFIAEYKL